MKDTGELGADGLGCGLELSSCDRRLPAWLVLLASLLVTGYLAYLIKSEVELGAQRKFAADCEQIQLRIESRLQAHKQVLLGGAALFDASREVDRGEWAAYARRVQIDRHFNGIQGLGFSLLIPPERLSAHIADIRSQGFPAYVVHPPRKREVYSAIVYLEPFTDRNLRAFGYDMYSEPVRRAAMDLARDSNDAVLSGKVVLLQETTKDVQAGALMYVPVYRNGAPVDTVEQRRAALNGWVYSPFRLNDLLGGVLAGWDSPESEHIHLYVYDGEKPGPESLLYASDGAIKREARAAPEFSLSKRMNLNGRIWTLEFEHATGELNGIDYSKVWIVGLGGIGASALLFLLALSQLNTRCSAQRIARELTAELRGKSLYARSLIEASPDPLVTISADGKVTDVNSATERVTGLPRERLIGSDFSNYFTEPEKARLGYRQVFAQGHVVDYPLAIRHVSGKVTEVLYNASVYRDAEGHVAGVFAAARDITELRRVEAALRRTGENLNRAQFVGQIGSWHLDVLSGSLEWSAETYRMFGVAQGTPVDLASFAAAIHPDDRDRVLKAWEAALTGADYDIEHRIEINGLTRWVRERAHIQRDGTGRPVLATGTVQDITERKCAEDQIRALAFYDTLTGLPNRRLLQDRIDQVMAASKRSGRYAALMFMDMDNFKPLNDGYGHDVGDLLLVQVAHRIRDCLRESDTVARFGGDEFVVLLAELDADAHESTAEARAVGEKIRCALAEPYILTVQRVDTAPLDLEHRCTASIGGVLFLGHEVSQEELLKQADVAMYRAKEAGRDRVYFHDR